MLSSLDVAEHSKTTLSAYGFNGSSRGLHVYFILFFRGDVYFMIDVLKLYPHNCSTVTHNERSEK